VPAPRPDGRGRRTVVSPPPWLRHPLVPYRYILAVTLAVAMAAWLLRERTTRTYRFHGASASAAAVRSLLDAHGWTEAVPSEQAPASLLWTDGISARRLRGGSSRWLGDRISAIPDLPDISDPSEFCAVLGGAVGVGASRPGGDGSGIGGGGDGGGVGAWGCLALPAQTAALELLLPAKSAKSAGEPGWRTLGGGSAGLGGVSSRPPGVWLPPGLRWLGHAWRALSPRALHPRPPSERGRAGWVQLGSEGTRPKGAALPTVWLVREARIIRDGSTLRESYDRAWEVRSLADLQALPAAATTTTPTAATAVKLLATPAVSNPLFLTCRDGLGVGLCEDGLGGGLDGGLGGGGLGGAFVVRLFVLLPGLSPLRAYTHAVALALVSMDTGNVDTRVDTEAADTGDSDTGVETGKVWNAGCVATQAVASVTPVVAWHLATAQRLPAGSSALMLSRGWARVAVTDLELSNLQLGNATHKGSCPECASALQDVAARAAVALCHEGTLRDLRAQSKRTHGRSGEWGAAPTSKSRGGYGSGIGELGAHFQLLQLDVALSEHPLEPGGDRGVIRANVLAASLRPDWGHSDMSEYSRTFGGPTGKPNSDGRVRWKSPVLETTGLSRYEELVLSDTLNLTGAALHPKQRLLRSELLAGLRRTFSVPKPREGRAISYGNKNKKRTTKTSRSGDTGAKADAGTAQRLAGCEFALPPERRPRSATPGAAATAGKLGNNQDSPGVRTPLELNPCISASELAALAHLETEFHWRHGFRSLDVATAKLSLRREGRATAADWPPTRLDELLERFRLRWANGKLH